MTESGRPTTRAAAPERATPSASTRPGELAQVIHLRGRDDATPARVDGTPAPIGATPAVIGATPAAFDATSAPRTQAGPAPRPRTEPAPAHVRVEPAGWERRIADGLAFLRRRITGDYEVDEFGFDPDLTDHVVVPAFRPLYEKWFRTEVHGAQNLPREGGALLVANHGGALWALDGVMTALAVHDSTGGDRYLRMLGADLVFSTPVMGPLARKTGSTLACQPDAERLLRNGELVGVWPEGFKGIGKPFSERYKLQRFGRGGFVTAALRTGVPIIPVSIVGAEEIHPMLFDAKLLARALGLPYFPITPTFPWLGPLGMVPLPSKWHIEFGAPIDTAHLGADVADDPLLTFELTDRVRETIQATLYRLLDRRTSPWN